MTCPTCGSIRLLCNDAIKCPNCDDVKLGNVEKLILALQRELAEAQEILDRLLKHTSYNDIFFRSLIKREEAAAILLENPHYEEAARDWISASLLLAMNDPSHEDNSVPFMEVFYASEQVICLYDQIKALINRQHIVLDDGSIIPTENEGLGFVPLTVLKALKESLHSEGFRDELLWSGELMIKELALSYLDLIQSETISRTLRSVFHERLIPHIHDSQTSTAFVDICLSLAGLIGFTLGPAFSNKFGTLEATPDFFNFIKSQIARINDPDLLQSFFERMGNSSYFDINGLGYTSILRNELSGNFHLTYHSLLLLGMATYKRTSSPTVGRAHNIKGIAPEEIIYNGVSGYLDTLHPINKEKLLRYDLPYGRGDIDVGGFNDEYLCIIESKFWDVPNITALEVELNKFEQNLLYIRDNLEKLGFNPSLKLFPIFYTPYPPFAKWGEITLIPSIFLLFWLLGSKFGIREFELLDKHDGISAFLDKDEEERAIPLDLSDVLKDIPENSFRIQDAILVSIDESEVSVIILAPGLNIMHLICDINNLIAEKIEKLEVSPGSLIRMALYNVSGGWTPTQLIDFKILNIASDKRLDPWIELTLANPKSTLEEFVRSNWGDEMGKEVLDFVSRWEIDLLSLIRRLSEKGQNVLSGVGIALGLVDMYEHIEQCSCGEIVACTKSVADGLRKFYPDGKLMCKACDPNHTEKLGKIHGREVRVMTLAETMMYAAILHKTRTESDAENIDI